MKRLIIGVLLLWAGIAWAQQPASCEKFSAGSISRLECERLEQARQRSPSPSPGPISDKLGTPQEPPAITACGRPSTPPTQQWKACFSQYMQELEERTKAQQERMKAEQLERQRAQQQEAEERAKQEALVRAAKEAGAQAGAQAGTQAGTQAGRQATLDTLHQIFCTTWLNPYTGKEECVPR